MVEETGVPGGNHRVHFGQRPFQRRLSCILKRGPGNFRLRTAVAFDFTVPWRPISQNPGSAIVLINT